MMAGGGGGCRTSPLICAAARAGISGNWPVCSPRRANTAVVFV
jgi:hypothetical protein